MKKQPAIIVMIVIWLLQQLVDMVPGLQVGGEMLEMVAEFVVMLVGALVIKNRVFSRDTIEKAGLDPEAVERAATATRANQAERKARSRQAP